MLFLAVGNFLHIRSRGFLGFQGFVLSLRAHHHDDTFFFSIVLLAICEEVKKKSRFCGDSSIFQPCNTMYILCNK